MFVRFPDGSYISHCWACGHGYRMEETDSTRCACCLDVDRGDLRAAPSGICPKSVESTAREAVDVEIASVQASCPCGGSATDNTGSFIIGADSRGVHCDTCDSPLSLSALMRIPADA